MLEQAAHDFAGAGFGEGLREADVIGLGNRADFFGDLLAQFFAQAAVGRDAAFDGHESDEGLAFEFVGPAHHRSFGHLRMAHQGALHFGGADAMAGDVEHVVNTAHDPEVAVFVLPAAVPGEVAVLDLTPVDFLVALGVTPDAAQHARPGLAQDQLAAGVARDRFAPVIHHFRHHTKKRQRRRAGLGRHGARQRGDEDAARFGLPPGVHNGAALAADEFLVPHPRFGIDWLTHGTEQAQRAEVMFLGPLDPPLHERADGGRRCVENRHAILLDDAPEPVRLGEIGRAFIH